MNHLRELLECKELRTGEGPPLDPDLDSDGRVQLATKRLQESASKAICFYLGSVREIAGLDSPGLTGIRVNLPFETVWFEFDFHFANGAPGIFGVMADSIGDGEARLVVFFRRQNEWNYLFTGITQENMMAATCDDDMKTLMSGLYVLVLGSIRTALCAMRCVNIGRAEHVPNERLQRARKKRGKLPLFSFWTLEIDMPKSRAHGQDFGGTHAAPRLHLRRGHPREYKPGLFCWVQPHAVGNKKNGIVHKDYAAKYTFPLPPNA